MANTFDWIEIRTNKIEETAAFYESLFGWKIIEKETVDGFPVWIFDTNGEPRVQNLRRGGIWARPPGEPGGIVVYVVVEDIDRMLKRLEELGGKIIDRRSEIGGGYIALIADPSGNRFGLYQDK